MNTLPEPLGDSLKHRLPQEIPSYGGYHTDPEEEGGDSRSEGTKLLSVGLVWRAFRRHWWQVGLLWILGSTALATMAYRRIKPTYDAMARVQVEPGEQSLYTSKSATPLEFAEFKETQVASITSPVVLSLALTEHPELFRLPMLQRTDDAESEIRRALKVVIVPKTNLIDLSLSSLDPAEPAIIVNAVLSAYLKYASTTSNQDIERRIEQLKADRDKRIRDLDMKRAELRRVSERIGAADEAGVKDRNQITSDDYRVWSDRLSQVEIDRIAAEAGLEQLRTEEELNNQELSRDELDRLVRDAFYAHPRIQEIQHEIGQFKMKLDRVRSMARTGRDPSSTLVETQLRAKQGELNAWWTRLRPGLEKDLSMGRDGQERRRVMAEQEAALVSLKAEERSIRNRLDQMKVRSKAAGGDGLELEFVRHDTEAAAEMLYKVEGSLNQLEHEARSPIARVREVFQARPAKRPNVNHRTKIVALAPVAMFMVVMGLFITLEARAGRVADPDELSSRARVQILGVVPPLPNASKPGTAVLSRREDLRIQRRLDEFMLSLDHLRVSLCARPDRWGRNRHCVLITSACGSEGKTTLAAQLAERCVNAGMLTLLIDGDLRNPSLSRMLDASEHDGLCNVLRGEVAAEDVMTVVGGGGGFHFLAAGTPRSDPNRLLQGDALGQLLARARESFDMIIVDAPPVLPVPDALIIGKWTDGAVLAVRYNMTRFSYVEKAQRRLAHVNVPILGAVVNGTRVVGSSYDSPYIYNASAEAEADRMTEVEA